jgi:hypothetical protein
VILAGLFTLAYFTHLVGYLQAALAATLLVLCRSGFRWYRLLTVSVALLPSLAFCADYMMSTGLTPSLIAHAITENLTSVRGGPIGSVAWGDLLHLNRDIFVGYLGWSIPVGLCCLLMFGAAAALWLYDWFRKKGAAADAANEWPVFVVLVVMGILYIAMPDGFGNHGGYLKPRLAIVLPVLGLALLRPPSDAWARYGLLGGNCTLVAAQLVCTYGHFAAANQLLDQYTAGIDEIGRGHVIYVIQTTETDPYRVNYLLHASHYYCLDTDCTNLDNYEAGGHYFPVRFRAGIWRGRGGRHDFVFHPCSASVDRIVAWEWPERRSAEPPNGFRTLLRQRSLTIYGRTAP